MRPTLFLLLVLSAQILWSQDLGLGFYSQTFSQPGLKVSYRTPLGNETYLTPQLGWFSRVGDNSNTTIGLDYGKVILSNDKRFTMGANIGAFYWRQVEKLGFTLDLGTGSSLLRKTEVRHYFVPTAGLDLLWQYEKLMLHVKNAVGPRFGSQESSLSHFLEIGVRVKLKSDE